jgi:DnaJ-domain-containing protein 1
MTDPPTRDPRVGGCYRRRLEGGTDTLGEQDTNTDEAARRYADWAERMRSKRRRDQARIRGTDAPRPAGPAHWGADTVIGREASHDTGPGPVVAGSADATRCLGVLGLGPGATPEQVTLAYKKLAKIHHPDRWAAADAAVQEHHSEEMLRVNAAYQTLRTSPSA